MRWLLSVSASRQTDNKKYVLTASYWKHNLQSTPPGSRFIQRDVYVNGHEITQWEFQLIQSHSIDKTLEASANVFLSHQAGIRVVYVC